MKSLQSNRDRAVRRLTAGGSHAGGSRLDSADLRLEAAHLDLSVRYLSPTRARLLVDRKPLEVRARDSELTDLDLVVAASYAARFGWVKGAILRLVWFGLKQRSVQLVFEASQDAARMIVGSLELERERHSFAWHSDEVLATFRRPRSGRPSAAVSASQPILSS